MLKRRKTVTKQNNGHKTRTGACLFLLIFVAQLVFTSVMLGLSKNALAAGIPLSPGCYDHLSDYTSVACATPEQTAATQANPGKCFVIWAKIESRDVALNQEINCLTGVDIPFGSLDSSGYEKAKRELYYSLICLEKKRDLFDFDDELTNSKDIIHQTSDDNNKPKTELENIPVGLDLDAQNGMRSCASAMIAGFNLVHKMNHTNDATLSTTNQLYDYLVSKITGSPLPISWASAKPVDGSLWDGNLDLLIQESRTALATLIVARPTDYAAAYRSRGVILIDACYDRYSAIPGSAKYQPEVLGDHDFLFGNGAFSAKGKMHRDDIIGNLNGGNEEDKHYPLTKAPYISAHNEATSPGYAGAREMYIGDYKLIRDFGDDRDDDDWFYYSDAWFYPFGIDIQMSGSPLLATDNNYSGVVSCAWAVEHKDILLQGLSIDENGDWIGLTEDEAAIIEDPTHHGGGVDGTDSPNCESEGGVLAWVTCSFIRLTSNGIDWIDGVIEGQLTVDTRFLDQATLKQAWSNIRNLAYLLLIPIMLVMVISTALGMDFISAYTVKRALPRMIAAVMFITLSWYVCGYLIDFFNTVGNGVRGIMESPFITDAGVDKITLQTLFKADSLSTVFESLAFGVGIVAGAIGLIFFFLPTFLLAIAIGWLVLTARQVLIVALVLLSPLAILAWIFPGNDKLWKLWWNGFTKLLMMYPLIMMLLSAGHIMAWITRIEGDAGFLNFILVTGMYCIPYGFIPATFKFAGGALATIAGVANDKSKGLFDRARNKRGQKFKDFKTGNFNGELGKRLPGFNRLGAGLGAGFSGRYGFGKRGRASMSQRSATAALDNAKNNAQLQQFAATDDDGSAVLALSGGTDAGAERAAELIKQRRIAAGMDEAEATAKSQRALAAARAVGVSRANAQSALTLMAQNKSRAVGAGDMDMVQEGINALAGGNSQLATDLKKNFQYHSRQAGRYDLGGDDPVSGAAKASLYQLANGHRSSIEALGTHHATAAAASGNYEDAAILDHELAAMLPNATGDVADEIHKQRAALRADGGLEAFLSTPTGKTKQVRVDWDGSDPSWSPTEQARGWRTETRGETMADVTKSRARVYQQPDPHNIP